MADDSELERLARRYLDLWESQLSAMAADSELAEQLGRLFAATNASLLAGVKTADAEQGRNAGDNTAASDRTSAAAAARGDGAVDVAELERRVAALERRLAALERRQSDAD